MTSVTPTILVVDDDAASRLLVGATLEREGWNVHEADDAESALGALQASSPDLILLDVVMPDRDGFDLIGDLRETAAERHVPIIFLSGLTDTDTRVRGFRAGAVDYVTKPFRPAEIAARVRTQLELAAARRSLAAANAELRLRQAAFELELEAAAEVQRRMVPTAAPLFPGVRSAWSFLPSERIGGDLFGVVPLGRDHLAAFVLDVSGHGLAAALMAALVAERLTVDSEVLMRDGVPTSPANVLAELDRRFPFERFERFFTIAYVLYERPRRRLHFARAGHPEPILFRAERTARVLSHGGPPIGLGVASSFAESTVDVVPGDRVFLFSDGIADAKSAAGESFGTGRCRAAFIRGSETLESTCRAVVEESLAFTGAARFTDDVTILGLEFSED